MKTKSIFIIIGFILALIIMQLSVYANELTLTISANKEELKIDDEIVIKVSWDKAMQAADFNLNYDKEKVAYIKSNIDDVYVANNEEKGLIKTSWASLDNKDKTEIEYTFKIKKGGEAKFTTTIDGGFATGNLEMPEKYNNGELSIKIKGNDIMFYVPFIVVIAIIIIALIIKKNNGGKK